jgi:hypothetical protein
MTATKLLSLDERIADALAAQWDGEFNPVGPDSPSGSLNSLIARVAHPYVDSAVRTLEVDGGSAWEPLKRDVGPEAIWTDLRPSQAEELMQLVSAAVDRAEIRARAIVEEELLEVGKKFAARYPDLRLAAER